MISILVVIYNCTPVFSRTINGFVNSKVLLDNVNLIIWNNGPKLIDENEIVSLRDKGCRVFLHQTPENRPLSWIYNDFIAMYSSDFYVILDHDSDVSDNYISSVVNFSRLHGKIGVPSVTVGERPVSPCVSGVYTVGPYTNRQRLFAIGSGVVVADEIAGKLKARYGDVFDPAFALYGVDATFFTRLFQLGCIDSVTMIAGFSHSLSRMETESPAVLEFRNRERSYDIGLQLRHYPSCYQLWFTIKVVVKILLGRLDYNIKYILLAYWSGKHPRC